ncbi:MAG TPA: nuclear transport factor 2 family protein [Gemmatimonadales bacterium]|nr:nuclear transport factor 2 family protein [Gemmatimonadales bacterium]
MNRSILLVALSLAPLSVPLRGQEPAVSLQRQVIAAESSFASTMARRELDAFAAFISPEAVFFGDTTVMRGKEAVVAGWQRFFVGPAPFSWRPGVVEVLASGTLALSSGPVFNPAGRKVGTFSSIWRREADGRWLIVFDKGCP